MSKKIAGILTIVLSLALVGVLVFVVYRLFATDFNGFGLMHGNTEIVKSVSNVSINDGASFQVKYYYGDTDDIEAYIEPIQLDEDFTFTVDGELKSWNTDIVGADDLDYTKMFDIRINDESNTVTVYGSVLQALKRLFVSDNVTLNMDIPSADMFKLYVNSSDTTITVNCRIYANANGIELTDGIKFGGKL